MAAGTAKDESLTSMRITQIRERTVPIAAPISNAYIDFSKMTCSVVAVITDVVIQEMRSYLERGYTVVKMKIGGVTLEEDQRRIDAVFEELGPGQRLAVDANGRFDK